ELGPAHGRPASGGLCRRIQCEAARGAAGAGGAQHAERRRGRAERRRGQVSVAPFGTKGRAAAKRRDPAGPVAHISTVSLFLPNIVMPGLVPGIHGLGGEKNPWMTGTSPATTMKTSLQKCSTTPITRPDSLRFRRNNRYGSSELQ